MSESTIDDDSWRKLTAAERTEAVRGGHATLRQLMQGLLDGPGELRNVCRDFILNSGLENRQSSTTTVNTNSIELLPEFKAVNYPRSIPGNAKLKSGLPDDFVPKPHRYGRSLLLEENIYRLPDGREFVPCPPTGTLGVGRHRYALLSVAQYQQLKRGSVYIRNDGRIFDYSVDEADPDKELFDTGFTMQDLERTGRYATPFDSKDKSRKRKARHSGSKTSRV
jgi:hypothetical protein